MCTTDERDMSEEQLLTIIFLQAEGHEYCDIADVEPSPSGDLLAFLIDSKGDEKYLMRIKNLKTYVSDTALCPPADFFFFSLIYLEVNCWKTKLRRCAKALNGQTRR